MLLRYYVYEKRDEKFSDLIATFDYKRDAEMFCEMKRKQKQYGTKKEYYMKEKEDVL